MDIGTLTGAVEIEDRVSAVLDRVIAKVENFATSFDGTVGKIAIGATGIIAGIAGISTAIVAMGNRGSDINDLSATLVQFTGSAEAASNVTDKLREGVLGTVTDFDLMKTSSKLLAGNVKLSADQFGLLGQAAGVLSNQGLGPTKSMLELVSSAMLTGRTRSLEMAIGKIDLVKAENAYAASLGTVRKDLTELERTEARRKAILEALNTKVKEAGEQHRDFGEIMQFVVAKVKNWFDQLSAVVAKSGSVQQALDAIGRGFTSLFGGSSEASVQAVAKGVDNFAQAIVTTVPYITEFLRIAGATVKVLWDWRDAILALVAGYAAWKGIQIAVRTYILLTTAATEAQTIAIYASVTAAKVAIATFASVSIIVASLAAVLTVGYNAWQLWREKSEQAATAARYQSKEAENLATVNARLGTSFKTMAEAQKETYRRGLEATAANTAAATAAKKLAEEQERVGKIAEQEKEQAKELYRQITQGSREMAIAQGVVQSLSKAQSENYDILSRVVPKLLEFVAANRQLTLSQIEMHARYVGMTLARNADEGAKLKDIGLTLEMVKQNQELGISLADMAVQYKVSEAGLTQYVTGLEKAKAAAQGYASFQAALYEQQAADRARQTATEAEVNKTMATLDEEYETEKTSRYQTETQKRIEEIKKEYAARVLLLTLGKSEADAAKIRTAAQRNMTQAIDTVNMADEQKSAFAMTDSKELNEIHHQFDLVNASAKTAALDGLQTFFTSLGQISGGGNVGKFMSTMGAVTAGLKSANDWAVQQGSDKSSLGGGFGSLSVMFNKNATGAQKFAAGIQSAAVIAQGAKNIWDATGQSASKAQNAFGGAMAGMQAGAALGPWGMAAGAAAGLVVGLVRGKPAWAKAADEVGRDFGVKISDGLAKEIAKNAKDMFKGSRQAASIYSLSDIIKEDGGVTDKNVSKYTSKLRDVFSMLETGAFDSAQAVKVLDENFESLVAGNTDSLGFWSSSLKEIIALNDRFGTQSKAIAEAVKGQVSLMLQSFNSIVAGTAKARKGYADIRKEIDDARETIKELNKEPERGRGVEWTKKMEEAQAALNDALRRQKEAGAGAGRELKDLGIIASAAFAAAQAKGMTFWEAMEAAGPGIADLRHAYEDLGLEIEDPFLKMLAVQSKVMESNPGLMQSVSGLSGALASMSNLNMLNADSFAAMGRVASDTYTRLQAEVAAAGGTSADALLPMQDYLHAAEKASKDLGLPLDANTQAMIDQSKELGIWKDRGPSAAEAMQIATENLTTAIENLTTALGNIPSSLPNPFANWTMPGSGEAPGFDSGGTAGIDWKPPSSRDVIPAFLREGEVVVTPEQIRASSMRRSDPRAGITDTEGSSTVVLQVDGKYMTDVVIKRLGGRLALGGVR